MIIANIADLHFGKLGKEEETYNMLKKHFIDRYTKIKPDIIFINGDSYDSRQLINSKANIYFNKFISDCIQTNAVIVIIEGTESHDRFQINALSHYISDKFFIVNTATKLNILGLKFLILPEEYVKDISYYKDYFNDKYDFVQFHGMFSHVGFIPGYSDNNYIKKPSIFDWKMFKDNVKYYVIGGHIHIHSIYKNIIYCGSFNRLNFGEEEPKGFIEVKLKNNKCEWEFIENTDAFRYKTIKSSELNNDTEKLLYSLRANSESNDYLRIIIDIEDDNKNNTIIGFVKNHPNCMIKRDYKSKTDISEEKIKENIKEKQDALKERMDGYKGLSFIEITQKIAKNEYKEDFTQEEIHDILNTKL